MRHLAALTFLATLALSGAGAAERSPQRVMSLNLCTDQLILQLLPPERITSVTFLSRSTEHSFLKEKAFTVPINYGTSEEVLRQHPDVVLAGNTSTPAVRELLRRVGAPWWKCRARKISTRAAPSRVWSGISMRNYPGE